MTDFFAEQEARGARYDALPAVTFGPEPDEGADRSQIHGDWRDPKNGNHYRAVTATDGSNPALTLDILYVMATLVAPFTTLTEALAAFVGLRDGTMRPDINAEIGTD